MFILWQICKNYVEILQVVVHNVSALCNCINDVLYVARIKKNSHNLKNDFRSVLQIYLVIQMHVMLTYCNMHKYMYRYKNINIHIKNLQSY